MASYSYGKREVENWIRTHIQRGSSCLDVGACDGIWSDMLRDYLIMDAVEIYRPNAEKLFPKYREVYVGDIAEYRYNWYDLTIFGDVIEHMTVEQAQSVLQYAREHSGDVIVAVPFMYVQGELYGNKWEKHIQDDLTEELFFERYGKWEKLVQPKKDYCYFHKGVGA